MLTFKKSACTIVITTRKRSCGKVMFLHLFVSHSVQRGNFCMMSLPVWLPGLMFLPGGLCLWSHVPSRASVSLVPCFFWGVSVQGLCPSRQRPPGYRSPGQRPSLTKTPWTETSCMVKSGWYAFYLNASLLTAILNTVFPIFGKQMLFPGGATRLTAKLQNIAMS